MKQKPGLVLLCIVLFFISIITIKIDYFLVGWDNYSSYFNLDTNIFRTFFATWREYRGLGVPSDSEVTDVFRQLFYFALSPVLKETILGQLYIVMVLIGGTIAMYLFSYLLARRNVAQSNKTLADIFGASAAFFYLFNLNTLATFYFPMIMYINRYVSLPLLFLIFFLLLQNRHYSKKILALFGIGLLFTAGTYVTATNIITMLTALSIFGVFHGRVKRFTGILLLYLALQAFWLLPFFNYTAQKSSIIRLAPTFINANESLLNKPKAFYDLEKNLILYPNFFDTDFFNLSQTQRLRFHPLATVIKEPLNRATLFAFPLLYFVGLLLILIKAKKHRQLLWVPTTIGFFLFLSLKEFSPLGFLYTFLNDLTPYFGVLFRFGDTKFHPLIAFAGSIAAAFAVVLALQQARRIPRIILAVPLLAIVFSTVFVFQSYLRGSLIGPFMYNKIPEAYFSIAKIINEDKEQFRVLHLPMSSQDYWKSYGWGMFGSSFFHFFIDKPFIDKTFEPASMEHAYLHKKLNDLLANTQLITNESDKRNRARDFATLLKKIGVKYIIFDDTVQAAMPNRNSVLWGMFNNADVRAMATVMRQAGFIDEVKQYTVVIDDQTTKTIQLFQVRDFQKKISFLPSATYVDSKFDNLLETNLIMQDTHWIQNDKNPHVAIYPFKRSDSNFFYDAATFRTELPLPGKKKEVFDLTAHIPATIPGNGVAHYVDVEVEKHPKTFVLRFLYRRAPTINGTSLIYPIQEIVVPREKVGEDRIVINDLTHYISDWTQLPQKKIGALRLLIGEYVLPIPAELTTSSTYIGTVALRGDFLPIKLVRIAQRVELDQRNFTLTTNPNCFFDKLEDASFKVTRDTTLHIASQNQSTCLYYDLKSLLEESADYAEMGILLQGESVDLDKEYDRKLTQSAKPALADFVTSLPKPNLVRLCVKEQNIDDCYNLHQLINVQKETSVVVPLERPVNGITNMILLVGPKNTGYQKQDIRIKAFYVDQYTSIIDDELDLANTTNATMVQLPQTNAENLSVSFPRALSQYSFSYNPQQEGLYGFNSVCDPKDGYRTYRTFENKLLTYFENCYNEFFQKVPFASDNFSFWMVRYNLLSGKYPRFIVDDGVRAYIDAYISLHQGYPDILGFKQFQAPQMWYNARQKEQVEKDMNALPLQIAFGYMPQLAELGDFSSKDIVVHQDGENEGAMLVADFTFQPLPASWADLRIDHGNPNVTFAMPENYSLHAMLPSLWKVEGEGINDNTLLLFNEGFDAQWRAYDSMFGVLFGMGTSYAPSRCDGYANCFLLDGGGASEKKTLYLFYTPERLAVLGWIITIAAFTIFLKQRVLGVSQQPYVHDQEATSLA